MNEPGCFWAPLDVTTRALVDDYAGGFADEVGAVVPGGAASGILPPAALDVPLTRDALREWGSGPGSAAVQVFPARYPVLRLLAETMRFFAEESCQKCTPCRIGNRALHHVAEELQHGRAAMTRDEGRRVAGGDGADLDLRPRPGLADPGAERLPALAGADGGTRVIDCRAASATDDRRRGEGRLSAQSGPDRENLPCGSPCACPPAHPYARSFVAVRLGADAAGGSSWIDGAARRGASPAVAADVRKLRRRCLAP